MIFLCLFSDTISVISPSHSVLTSLSISKDSPLSYFLGQQRRDHSTFSSHWHTSAVVFICPHMYTHIFLILNFFNMKCLQSDSLHNKFSITEIGNLKFSSKWKLKIVDMSVHFKLISTLNNISNKIPKTLFRSIYGNF